MSGDPKFDNKIAELAKFQIWPRLLVSKPDPGYLAGVKSVDLRQKLEEEEVEKEIDSNYQAFFQEFLGIEREMHVKSTSYFAPFLKLTEYQATVGSTPLSQLQSQIELAEMEIELLDETTSLLAGSITESSQNYMAKHNEVQVEYRRGGLSWGQHIFGLVDWEKHVQETNEKIQVLAVGRLWFQKVLDIYRMGIAEREARKPEIEQRIKAATKLCHDAENLVQKIQKAERACQDSNYADTKAVKEFVVSWQRLDKLRNEFATVRGSGVEFQDFGKPEPIFPDASLATEHAAAVKGNIFTVFEKNEQEKKSAKS